MSRIKGRDTGLERAVADALRQHGLNWDAHRRDLPGCPDFVFRDARLALFVDGDFWHGWRFPAWRSKLSELWEAKIEGNVKRDQRNRRRLRSSGWAVLRLWEHQIEQDLHGCVAKVLRELKK
jgi:DNA mismatch endonuclease (patch repair protein)